jgi:hypothetical protein
MATWSIFVVGDDEKLDDPVEAARRAQEMMMTNDPSKRLWSMENVTTGEVCAVDLCDPARVINYADVITVVRK